MIPTRDPRLDPDARRKAVRRTALWIGGIVLAVYVAFILSGVVGR
ncbi:hypothetical protein [Novilysobacter arseniciresistens]|nr:hypothetical protein [Lysobacter arseniciresistens]